MFNKNRSGSDGLQHYCKCCQSVASQKWRKAYPHKQTYKVRNLRPYWLNKKYNLSVENFEQLIVLQGNKCAICNIEMIKPNVDHCHSTGIVRGLLCTTCNTGLGQFKDSIDLLEIAVKYLGKIR